MNVKMNNLKNLFYKTKLASTKWEKYFPIYEKLFSKYKNKSIVFVEIGIAEGGSLKIWKKFFGKKAKIIGIDLNPKCKKFKTKGIDVFIGSQSDPKFWKKFFKKVGKVDIILDDGGHTNKQQILTVLNTIKNIKNGGKLIIEDTHASYMSSFGNPNKFSFINFAKKVIDEVNYTFPFEKLKKNKFNLNKYIYGISFYESIVEFKIDKSKCKINKFISNSGLTNNIEDYRHKDSALINKFNKLKKNIKFFKRAKFQKINYFIENLSLRKFFN